LTAPKEIHRLVAQFEQNLDSYKSGRYNETQLRQEFLDPFFKALGWDMDNTQGHAEAYKDVIHEDAIRIGGAVKAPDYCFRIGGTRKFFLEAKKPSVDIGEEVSAAYQLRRYAWSAKLPLSILSDFEELAVYDCRIKPNKTDSAATARIFYCRFQDYLEKWDWISSIFSKEAVLKGSFDKFAETSKTKRGTAEVDDDILATIESWRNELARNIAMRNSRLSQRELNFAVQRIIDRIIFLRICEDRGIELYGRLLGLTNGPGIYRRLGEVFQDADAKFNSGLFYFRTEKGRYEPPDEITLDLDLDDKILRDLLHGLYYPDSPYEFTVLSADILGQVYEQFLGKVIRLTEGHHAVVEDKPEVKKAGGVYYTPAYIVDYIVRQTVGKLSEGKTPKQAANLRVLDPACGSGSFLINAYQFLLDWHRDWYVANRPEQWAKGRTPALVETTKGWKLTIAARKRILLDNIYGVDIDPQAVEVTKLSLLLKVLEGESEQTIQPYLRLFHERALPDLGNNIKCGNSLIGPDFYQQKELPFLTDDERLRINVFDWDVEFPNIMKAGGFDAVIGNPPYGASLGNYESAYLRTKFTTSNKDLDTYSLFMEKAVVFAKNAGQISMIVPTGWYSGSKYSSLRRFLSERIDPIIFINLPYDIFNAWVDTTVFIFKKRAKNIPWPRKDAHMVSIKIFPKRYRIHNANELAQDAKRVRFSDWFIAESNEFLTYADSISTALIRKIISFTKPLGQMADVQRGVTPFNLTSKPMHENSRPAFNGTVRRYMFDRGDKLFIRFDESLAELKPERYFMGPRLLLREIISRKFQLQATKATEAFITNKSMQSILQLPKEPDLNYLLGIINSRLISWYFLHRSNVAQRDDFPKIVLKESRSLPIRPINFNLGSDKTRYSRIIALVEEIIELIRQIKSAKTPHEKESLQREIDATDKQIDQLVYELYGLTEDEIKIVEEAYQTIV
jgi:type I restriction-modification system DNA methylase subunit